MCVVVRIASGFVVYFVFVSKVEYNYLQNEGYAKIEKKKFSAS